MDKDSKSNKQSTSEKTIYVNSTTETATDQFQLETARQQKKRELKTKQYSGYMKSLYGTPAEKETVRRDQREALLKQVRDKEENIKDTTKNKVKESETAVAYDRECLDSDRQQKINKATYLQQFRDGNKQLIETRSEEKRRQREDENRRERDLLRQNPINWSNTLC